MTWVMASPTLFGSVICLSDIQVTYEDKHGVKKYKDCVQKSYQFDKNIVAGFAGSVGAGFGLLNRFSKFIKESKPKDKTDFIYEPVDLINSFAPVAKKNFQRLRPEFKGNGVHILISGISHTRDNGISGQGFPTVAILKSPLFIPEYIKIGKWGSIGQGSSVDIYKKILNDLTGDPYHPLMQLQVGSDHGFARALAFDIFYEVQKLPHVEGISQHFHIALIAREGIYGGTSDHEEYPLGGEKISVRMPKVATTFDEFFDIAEDLDANALA